MTAGTPPRPRAPSSSTTSGTGSGTGGGGEPLANRLVGGAVLVITVLAILVAACAAVALASSTGTLSAPPVPKGSSQGPVR